MQQDIEIDVPKLLTEQRQITLNKMQSNIADMKAKLLQAEQDFSALREKPIDTSCSYVLMFGYFSLGRLFSEISDSLDESLSNLASTEERLNSNDFRYVFENATVLFQFGEIFSDSADKIEKMYEHLINPEFVKHVFSIDIQSQLFDIYDTYWAITKTIKQVGKLSRSPFGRYVSPERHILNAIQRVCKLVSKIEYAMNEDNEFIGIRLVFKPLDLSQIQPTRIFVNGESQDCEDDEEEEEEDQ